MQFLSGYGGVGRYFETPAAYAEGERFEIAGADGDYQAPVAGVGRYFETPAAYAEGERFEIEGADGAYQAPVAGVGRYFEDAFGMKHGERFLMQGANKRYWAPEYGGTSGLGTFKESLDAANPWVLLGVGALGGALIYHAVLAMSKR